MSICGVKVLAFIVGIVLVEILTCHFRCSLGGIHLSRTRKKLHIFSQDSIVFCSICQIWINALEAWLARQFLTDSDAKFMSGGESKK